MKPAIILCLSLALVACGNKNKKDDPVTSRSPYPVKYTVDQSELASRSQTLIQETDAFQQKAVVDVRDCYAMGEYGQRVIYVTRRAKPVDQSDLAKRYQAEVTEATKGQAGAILRVTSPNGSCPILDGRGYNLEQWRQDLPLVRANLDLQKNGGQYGFFAYEPLFGERNDEFLPVQQALSAAAAHGTRALEIYRDPAYNEVTKATYVGNFLFELGARVAQAEDCLVNLDKVVKQRGQEQLAEGFRQDLALMRSLRRESASDYQAMVSLANRLAATAMELHRKVN